MSLISFLRQVLWSSVKGQVLADFMAEFTLVPGMEEKMEPIDPPT